MSIRTEHSSLRQGLVGCWVPSLGGSGLLLPNRARQSNNATHNGAITAAPGGTTLDLSGTQFADLGSAATLYPSLTSITFSVWARLRSLTNANNTLLETNNPNTTDKNYQFGCVIRSNGKLGFFVTPALVSGQTFYDGTGLYTLSLNTWYHLCFVFLGGVRQEGWVDGRLDGSVAIPVSSLVASTFSARVGFSAFANRAIDGQFDDARIYSRALTPAEIRLLASRRGIGLTPMPHRAAGLPRKLSVNVGGTWRAADSYVNVGGVWKLGQASVNVAGTWR